MNFILLNPSSASAGLKLKNNYLSVQITITTKPFFGFGWIETLDVYLHYDFSNTSTKPFFGFGWIETLFVLAVDVETVYY